MQTKRFGRNLLWVVVGRVIALLSSVAVGLLLPKIFSVTDYGYFKMFTLYAVYTGLLHFGFIDGILLKLAGKEYEELDVEKVRAYTKFFVLFEVLVALAVLLIGGLLAKGELLFIVIMLVINMVAVNVTSYYQFVSQATQRFREYSVKNLILSGAKLLLVGGLFLMYALDLAAVSYKIYLVCLNLLDVFMMLWYIFMYRGITFGKKASFSAVKRDIIDIFKVGIVLTAAYQVSHLVLALDRQFVNLLFPMETFAVYSFGYNIVTMISTVVSSVSTVLLPMLKKGSREVVVGYYKKGISMIAIVMACAIAAYFPLVLFIRWFLPGYVTSLTYIAVILPALVFTSGVTVIMFTVEKVLGTNLSFFKTSCVIFALGFVTNVAAYLIFKSPLAISYASLLTMAVWFLLESCLLGRRIGVGAAKEFAYILLISALFLSVTHLLQNVYLGFLLYVGAVAVLTLVMYLPLLKGEYRRIRSSM